MRGAQLGNPITFGHLLLPSDPLFVGQTPIRLRHPFLQVPEATDCLDHSEGGRHQGMWGLHMRLMDGPTRPNVQFGREDQRSTL